MDNVFQFDDTFWLQLTGTAMGTSLACMYASIYYSFHEETRILPVYAHQYVVPLMMLPPPEAHWPSFSTPPLLSHARLIDDAAQIWDLAKMPANMNFSFVKHMKQAMKFGTLEWTVESPSSSIDFLDLTITVEQDGTITSKTFVKDMNLHLYIPPHSAHPRSVLKSLIFGNIQRYWTQNTREEDFLSISTAFYGHLLNRGWTHEMLAPVFHEAADAIDRKMKKRNATGDMWGEIPPTPTPTDRLFLQWEYHPRDIGRRTIRQIFEETLAPALSRAQIPVGQLTIAYSVPQSLGQCLTKTQLEEPDGYRVSSYVELME
jgi:hypothetical protein